MVETRPLGELLASHMQVHLVDLPGFGKSPPPNEVWSSFDYAQCLVDYLKKRGIDKAHWIGHSFGGKVAMSAASRHPEAVETMTLIAAAGLQRKRSWKETLRRYGIAQAGTIFKTIDHYCKTRLFEKVIVTRFASSDYRNAGAMRSILVKSVNEDLQEHAARVRAPTLLLWGEEDSDTPVEMGRRLHQLIPGSQLYAFPGKNHHLPLEGGASLCASYILNFLGVR